MDWTGKATDWAVQLKGTRAGTSGMAPKRKAVFRQPAPATGRLGGMRGLGWKWGGGAVGSSRVLQGRGWASGAGGGLHTSTTCSSRGGSSRLGPSPPSWPALE